ncbi:MAG: prolyl oligopeptidase family serine peptidase [Opitutaceae bacterium]|nr:prolyl oligopeptidase family serine peptidase [Verrucomicrobiales bacterium]
MFTIALLIGFVAFSSSAQPQPVKQLPPPGIKISDSDRQELTAGAAALGREIAALNTTLKPGQRSLLPDVQIYHKAVDWALRYNEFYKSNEVGLARTLLKSGQQRAAELRDGRPSWTTATGLVVRAYVSKVDGSIQPYGLVIPSSLAANPKQARRLDCWFHGRDETLTELKFVSDREKNRGEFTPPDAIVLHLYGRYCNASKFAGETDFFEALADVRKNYSIDENRIAILGFSMGGASVWHLATHHAGVWVAASPGAGFAETPEYLKVFKSGTPPPSYEQKLWHLYNATDYAVNLLQCPTIAYSGEIDPQKQSADVMEDALSAEGLRLTRIIGLNTGHKYEPEAKKELIRQFDVLVAKGRDPVPRDIRFTTWTLRYNQMKWLTVDGLDQHWERAQVYAAIADATTMKIDTANVSALTLSFAAGLCPLEIGQSPKVILDGETITAGKVGTDRSWTAHFQKTGPSWKERTTPTGGALRKQHGLQGPIDDAFMDSFIVVRPTGKALNEKTSQWVDREMTRAVEQWRAQFRGDAQVKNDTEVSDADLANHNVVLWGDPSSNRLLARLISKLPLKWDAGNLQIGGETYSSSDHAPVMIYPNPLNPKRYVVLNSGFTFRGFGSNADQTPKLPDYAIIEITKPATTRAPGGVALAGFFDESWQVKKP